MRPDISVSVFGRELEYPLMLAACELSNSGARCREAAKAGAAAIVAKSHGPMIGWPRSPRTWVMRDIGTMIQVSGSGAYSPKEWIQRELRLGLEGGAPIIPSAGGLEPGAVRHGDVSEWQSDLVGLVEAGAAWFEFMEGPPEAIGPNAEMKSRSLDLFCERVVLAKEVVDVPIVVKLGYRYPSDMVSAAKKLEKAGADGLTLGGGNEGIKIDVNTGRLVGALKHAAMNVNGREGFHMWLKVIFDVVANVNIPVFGCHGIYYGRDVIEHLMAGATCSQMAACAMIEGLGAFRRIRREIEEFMEEKGYKSLDEIRGIAQQRLEPKSGGVKAAVNESLCNGCGLCTTVCYAVPIAPEQRSRGWLGPRITVDPTTHKAIVNEELCEGCGACMSICPQKAISLNGWPP